MKSTVYLLNLVLAGGLLLSLTFLIYVVAARHPGWESVAAESLLVVVLAAEGLFAIFHLQAARGGNQAEALRDFMHDFCSIEALAAREKLYTDIPWEAGFGNIPKDLVQWNSVKEGKVTKYKMDGKDCTIEVSMGDGLWAIIQRLSDQYHFAGLCCERGYMVTEDVLIWIGPQPLRWWRRLGGIILQERLRRGHPTLFAGFEKLATAAEKFFREHYPNLTRL